jgi:3-hydroxyisobutyrate dehydrogenase
MNVTRGESVGIIGLGDMGLAVAQRLAEGGWDLVVHDVRAEPVRTLPTAKPVDTPAAVAAASHVILIWVVDDDQVRAVLSGPDGVLAGLRPGAIVALHSSVLPATAVAVGAQIAAAGGRLVDAPVSGARIAAERGTLTVMAGGANDDIDDLREVFAAYATTVLHLGAVGAGQAMKLVNNVMLHMNHLVAIEAVNLGTALGLDEDAMLSAVNVSTGRSWATENWAHMDDLLTSHPQAAQGTIIRMMTKELWHATEVARHDGGAMPITAVGIQVSPALLRDRARLPEGT